MRQKAPFLQSISKAFAHIHLALAGLPPCGEEQALRLFVADEPLGAVVTSAELVQAQGFGPALLAPLKYSSTSRVSLPGAAGKAANGPATTAISLR